MTWKDYGMSKKEKKIVERFCTDPDKDNQVIIKAAIYSTNKSISRELYNSIVHKQSYAKQCARNYIPIGEKDFYGYRRKAIYKIYRLVTLLGLNKIR